jgi:hypothetical protein
MYLDGVFALFGFHGDDGENKKLESEIEEFKNTPKFKIGMFIKLIINGISFKKQIISFFEKADPELESNNINEAGEFLMYTRAWYWISQCSLKSKYWREALKNEDSDNFIFALESSIKYFEGVEEYEKCAFLRKIQVFLEKARSPKEF